MNKRPAAPIPLPNLTTAERAAVMARHAEELTTDTGRSALDRAHSLTQRLHELEQERLLCANDRIEALADLIEAGHLRRSSDLQRLLKIDSRGTVWPLWTMALGVAKRRK